MLLGNDVNEVNKIITKGNKTIIAPISNDEKKNSFKNLYFKIGENWIKIIYSFKLFRVAINTSMKFFLNVGFVKRWILSILIVIFWSLTTQISLANTTDYAQAGSNQQNISQEIYLRNCSSCHIPLPAQILPTESWQKILNSSQNHYGVALPRSVKVSANFIWIYLKQYSRPSVVGETLPTYISNSRYLKALHPNVQLPKPANHNSCQSCHPFAQKLDYFTVSES